MFRNTVRSLDHSHANPTQNHYATVDSEEIVEFIKVPYIPIDNIITLFIILNLHHDYQIVPFTSHKIIYYHIKENGKAKDV